MDTRFTATKYMNSFFASSAVPFKRPAAVEEIAVEYAAAVGYALGYGVFHAKIRQQLVDQKVHQRVDYADYIVFYKLDDTVL